MGVVRKSPLIEKERMYKTDLHLHEPWLPRGNRISNLSDEAVKDGWVCSQGIPLSLLLDHQGSRQYRSIQGDGAVRPSEGNPESLLSSWTDCHPVHCQGKVIAKDCGSLAFNANLLVQGLPGKLQRRQRGLQQQDVFGMQVLGRYIELEGSGEMEDGE